MQDRDPTARDEMYELLVKTWYDIYYEVDAYIRQQPWPSFVVSDAEVSVPSFHNAQRLGRQSVEVEIRGTEVRRDQNCAMRDSISWE